MASITPTSSHFASSSPRQQRPPLILATSLDNAYTSYMKIMEPFVRPCFLGDQLGIVSFVSSTRDSQTGMSLLISTTHKLILIDIKNRSWWKFVRFRLSPLLTVPLPSRLAHYVVFARRLASSTILS